MRSQEGEAAHVIAVAREVVVFVVEQDVLHKADPEIGVTRGSQ